MDSLLIDSEFQSRVEAAIVDVRRVDEKCLIHIDMKFFLKFELYKDNIKGLNRKVTLS